MLHQHHYRQIGKRKVVKEEREGKVGEKVNSAAVLERERSLTKFTKFRGAELGLAGFGLRLD